ncbi:T9SS type A sorting domain-containing protein [Amniculibacterium sp. G2-70]|uniref:Ig-like domain-containing protein n=1 Tax=Amniculibacterium sp. G2-70 TaxID=2767188 RepID=UPI0016544FC4|nr:T9SS type A sorting domain-containing protein [Amniculibacterium sp. G2-70]
MKPTYQYIVAFIVFLVTHIPIYSQYNGGIADGSSLNILGQVTCSTPGHYYTYMGGSADGNSVDTKMYAICDTPPGSYAYLGGVGDGSTVHGVSYHSCGLAPGAYAYLGGIGDGSGLETKSFVVCAYPPQFYTYFGGNSDGAVADTKVYCTPTPPVANFTAAPTEICVNQTVQFTDASTNAVAWEWTFTGGTVVAPSTLNSQNPVVKYTTAGTYAVSLKAINQDGENTVTKTAYIKVNATASISGTSPNSRCGAGSVTLSATPNSGTVKWYDAATGGTLLFTGNSFTTPSISTTTTYYAEAFNGCTASTRTPVVATVNTVPTLTAANVERCGPGVITLTANPSTGTVKWYDAATGGTELGTGTTYTTPGLTATTIYYAETTSAQGCTSTRIAVDAVIKPIPTITSTTPASRCGTGQLTLQASSDMGTLSWYDAATGGNLIHTGNSFLVNTSATVTYWVEAGLNGCISNRVAVTATINDVPTVTSTTPASVCVSGSMTISATASSGNIKWYDAPTGGNLLGSGNNFATPVLSSTTVYYAEADNGTCSSVRSSVVAEVKQTSPPVVSSSINFCIGDVLNNTPIVGNTITWYDQATNGNVVPGSTLLTNGTTYYATQTVNGCESSRVAVTFAQSTGCLGANDVRDTKVLDITVYPVPVVDYLNVVSPEEITKIEIYSLSGQKVVSKTVESKKTEIDFQSYPAAGYLLRVFTKDRVKDVKIIKK